MYSGNLQGSGKYNRSGNRYLHSDNHSGNQHQPLDNHSDNRH
jgi:hypothetical protein